MNWIDIGFYGLAAGILATSVGFLFLKNPIRILLSFSFLVMQIAGLMMLLDAVFVALLFLVFYTALLSLLLVFYMMTQNHSSDKIPPLSSWYKGGSFLVVAALVGQILFMLLGKAGHFFQVSLLAERELVASPSVLGELLYNDYSFFIIYLGLLFFSVFMGIVLMIGPKKLKLSKQSSVDKVQRDINSVELRNLKFAKPCDEDASEEKTAD